VGCAADEPAPEEEEAPAAEAKEAEPQGPYYELTKDDITTHEGWTSRNITLLGAKIGDKTNAVSKNFGKLVVTEPMGDYYRTVYDDVSYAIYTHQMTGVLHKIEIYNRFAPKVKDANLRKMLSSGDVETVRKILGPEEGLDLNPSTTGEETIYDAKGFRFVKYNLEGGTKLESLLFSQMKK
jgi:hypothetical protein